MKYILELTEDQAKVVSTACEFYARIRMGQFNEIVYHNMMSQPLDDNYCDRRDAAETYLLTARKYIYPDLGGAGHSYGIGKFEDADMSFDVYQVLRELMNGGPTPFSYNELPKAEMKDD